MFRSFDADTADAVWQAIAATFRSEGIAQQESRGGPTRELLHATISIRNPIERWVISRNPPINPAFALAEVLWIMAGRNDAGFINSFNSKLPDYAGHGNTYHGAYGRRLRKELGFDQLERGFHALQSNPDSRQVVLQIWDGRSDLPNADGIAPAPDIPCNLMSMLKVRGGNLEWTQILRSNDLFLGLPYNIVQFTSLQEIMAGWLGIGIGSYNQLSDSLHVYSTSEKSIANSLPLTNVPSNSDSLRLPRYESSKAFDELVADVDNFIDPRTSGEDIARTIRSAPLTAPFNNILCVIGAEILRRKGHAELATEAIAQCQNKVFVNMFERWWLSLKPLKEARG